MNIQTAVEIASLATNGAYKDYGRVSITEGVSFYRFIPSTDVAWLLSIFSVDNKKVDYQICILKNGDVFARHCPYFDGGLDGLMLVHNQERIRDLLREL